jgi:hypothetical protein
VINVCKKAIDDAAAGGGFVLSTGSRAGGIHILAMVETVRTYGKY